MPMFRILWIICMGATAWFALIPPAMGGLGGHGYHGVAFMLLGLLTPAAFPRLNLVAAWLVLLAFGGGIELAQTYLDTQREGEWADFRIDAIAATVGIVYARIWRYLHARVKAEGQSARRTGTQAQGTVSREES